MSKIEKSLVLLAVALYFIAGYAVADYHLHSNVTGDVNHDKVVNAQDLSIVLSHWTVTAAGAGNGPVLPATAQVQPSLNVLQAEQSGGLTVNN